MATLDVVWSLLNDAGIGDIEQLKREAEGMDGLDCLHQIKGIGEGRLAFIKHLLLEEGVDRERYPWFDLEWILEAEKNAKE